jgi:hypothetical protein
MGRLFCNKPVGSNAGKDAVLLCIWEGLSSNSGPKTSFPSVFYGFNQANANAVTLNLAMSASISFPVH